jgi:hypothetical protein
MVTKRVVMGEGAVAETNSRKPPPSPFLLRLNSELPSPTPNSGLPEFGSLNRPKSDKSDFGWERAQLRRPRSRPNTHAHAFHGSRAGMTVL